MPRRIRAARASLSVVSRFSFATAASAGVIVATGGLGGCGGDTLDVNALFAGSMADASTDASIDGSVAHLSDGGSCTTVQTVCRDTCVDEATDPANCGGCGNTCASTESCTAGQCIGPSSVCPTGQSSCTTSCVDEQTDGTNCGGCGVTCGANETCVAGSCSGCQSGFTHCDSNGADGGTDGGAGSCVMTSNDPHNCGGCGIVCTNGNVCTNGACAPSCASGQIVCASTVTTATPDAGASDAGDAGDAAVSNVDAGSPVPICVDPTSDIHNCGGCGDACTANGGAEVATVECAASACKVLTCATGFSDCNGTYADGCETVTNADPSNCGGCGAAFACATGDVCVLGACVVPGGGGNNTLTVNGTTSIDATETRLVSGTAGASTVTVTSTAGITANSVVLLVQMQGATAGTTEPLAGDYEENTVASVNALTNTLTLNHSLAHTYNSTGTNQAQVVVVPQYTDVTVASTGILTAPAWNGVTGGILAFDATGTVSIAGQVTMAGKGFRGTSHVAACTAAAGTKYECTVANSAMRVGYQGESPSGAGAQRTAANLSGGGGGGDGRDCGNGAGGGYGSAGANGGAALPFDMPQSCGVDPKPGTGGASFGTSSLASTILLGGAGGEGGADEDGSYPGGGGNGGGIVFFTAPTVTIASTGSVNANGAAGTAGSNSAKCTIGAAPTNGSYGEGGGGGGAGGAIRILTTTATLGSGLVTATGAGGGLCGGSPAGTPPGMPAGGAGGDGRIGISAKTFSGTTSTSPAYTAD